MCLKQPELVPLIANVPFLLAPLVPRQPTPDLWIRIVHKVYNLSLYFSTWSPFGRDFLWRNGRSCNRDLPHRVVAQDSTFCVLSGQNPKEEQLFFLETFPKSSRWISTNTTFTFSAVFISDPCIGGMQRTSIHGWSEKKPAGKLWKSSRSSNTSPLT